MPLFRLKYCGDVVVMLPMPGFGVAYAQSVANPAGCVNLGPDTKVCDNMGAEQDQGANGCPSFHQGA